MNNDPLAQLRDIRLPIEPDWWPLAFGWWIIAALTLVGCIVLARLLINAYQIRRPIRAAQQLMQDLFAEHSLGGLTDLEFVHRSNTLLKRLLVAALDMETLAKASNSQWLEALDSISGSHDFTQGPGQILGLQRFNPSSTADITQLKQLLNKLTSKVHPTKTKIRFNKSVQISNSQLESAHD
jgi:hypothetical protein|tara:strand:+ start:679 stop:1224 length:546 start_codon:yes stop_codon:yes gene_type:complete